jgi:hypothetical protein
MLDISKASGLKRLSQNCFLLARYMSRWRCAVHIGVGVGIGVEKDWFLLAVTLIKADPDPEYRVRL